MFASGWASQHAERMGWLLGWSGRKSADDAFGSHDDESEMQKSVVWLRSY
jgi:hypothetical protein